MIYNDITKANPKKGDLVLYVNKPSEVDKRLKQGTLFKYEGLEDGYVVLGNRVLTLELPTDLGDVLIPNPKREKSSYQDGLRRMSKQADEIYVGLDSVVEGLLSHEEFESYGAVAQYYANLRPKVSKFDK